MTKMTSDRSLRDVQHWMQSVIVAPDGVHSETHSRDDDTAIEEFAVMTIDIMILPSRKLTSQQRMEVYANAYYARLLECLRDEFPALVSLLGQETFDVFASEYLQSYPSQSYTLADLGNHFGRFLENNRDHAIDGECLEQSHAWVDLLVDLAELERTYSEVFSGPGIETSEAFNAEAISAIPAEQVGMIRLVPAPCVKLLVLKTRAHEYAIAVRKGVKPLPTVPESAATFIVITRINYVVRTIRVEPDEFHLLQKLVDDVCLEQAIASVAEQSSLSEEQLANCLSGWFQKWAMDRLFVGIKPQVSF